jgi:hypothetical protein
MSTKSTSHDIHSKLFFISAVKYRNAELPFKVYDVPEFDYVVNRWSDAYLSDVLGS